MITATREHLLSVAPKRKPGYLEFIEDNSRFDGKLFYIPDDIFARARSEFSLPDGLGDKVERMVKPIAKALRLKCLDKYGNLKRKSACAERRDRLNKF